jgi:hypothetical protein
MVISSQFQLVILLRFKAGEVDVNMETDEELLRHYYATGDNEILRNLLTRYISLLDRFLQACVNDQEVIVDIWNVLIQILRQSRRHPEVRFDLSRGPVRGYIFCTAGHLAYRWLVELKDPQDFL